MDKEIKKTLSSCYNYTKTSIQNEKNYEIKLGAVAYAISSLCKFL